MLSLGLGLVSLAFYQEQGAGLVLSNNSFWFFDDPDASGHLLTCGLI